MSHLRGSADHPPSYDQSAADDTCKKSPFPPSPAAPVAGDNPSLQFSCKLNQIYLSWVPVPAGGPIPPRAVEGRDSVGVFVARAHHGYHLLPGKAARLHRCCHASHAGAEMRFQEYEVLCDSAMDGFGRVAYDWVPCDGAELPKGALAAGYSDRGEPLFVARGSVGGERVFGYAAASLRGASFPWGGKEHRSCDFEVLVPR